jgi:hypothetical protein
MSRSFGETIPMKTLLKVIGTFDSARKRFAGGAAFPLHPMVIVSLRIVSDPGVGITGCPFNPRIKEVACASGTSNFRTVASDSPSSLRSLDVG